MSAVQKSLALACKAAATGAADAADLAAIKPFLLREFKPEELYVRTVALAHNGIDRDQEVFDEPVLENLAKTLPGKGLFEVHPTSWQGDQGMPEGMWFAANVERMSFAEARSVLREPNLQFPPDRNEAAILFAKFYLPAMAANEPIRTKIDAGLGFASIGFTYGETTPIRDAAGREMNARRLTGEREALEASLVWLGAQQGARAIKNHDPNRSNDVNDKTKTPEQLLADAQAEAKTAQTELATLKVSSGTAAATVEALKKALGESAALIDTPAELAALIADGKSYRSTMVDDVVAWQRAQGAIKGDSEADVSAAKSAFAAMPTAQLKTLHGVAKAAPSAPAMKPGDPNATKGAGDAKAPDALDSNLI